MFFSSFYATYNQERLTFFIFLLDEQVYMTLSLFLGYVLGNARVRERHKCVSKATLPTFKCGSQSRAAYINF